MRCSRSAGSGAVAAVEQRMLADLSLQARGRMLADLTACAAALGALPDDGQ